MKRILQVAAMAAGLAIAVAAPAQAVSIETYNEWKYNDEPITISLYEMLKLRLKSVYEGMDWLNVASEQEGKGPIYCPPQDLDMPIERIIQMIEEELLHPSFDPSGMYPPDIPIELVLLKAVQKELRC